MPGSIYAKLLPRRADKQGTGAFREADMRAFLKLAGIAAGLLIALLLTPHAVFAQGYATIRGTVTDSTGAVIPGAEVTATRASTGLKLRTTTNTEGTYVFPRWRRQSTTYRSATLALPRTRRRACRPTRMPR